MKHNVLLTVTAAALLLFGFGLNTAAAAERAVPKRGVMVERVKQKLEITDEQLAKIKNTVAAEKETIIELLRRLHTARTELQETIRKSDATESDIRGAAAKVAAIEADAAVLRAKLHKKIAALLTSEQETKLKGMQSNVGKFVDHLIDRIGEHLGEK